MGIAVRLLLVPLFVSVVGCANVSIYSEARDKQGQAAMSAWNAANASAKVTTARDNLKALLDRELATEDKIVRARRDELIRSMAAGASVQAGLITTTVASLSNLAGSSDIASQWVDAVDLEQQIALDLEAAQQQFTLVGVEMPSCDALQDDEMKKSLKEIVANGGFRGQVIDGTLPSLRSSCKDPDRTATQRVPLGGSMAATQMITSTRAFELEKTRNATMSARNAYRAALEAHDKTAAELAANPDARAKVQEAAAKLQKAVAALSKASDVFSAQFLSEQRQQSLDQFLAAVADTKPGEAPPEGASRAAVALILLPDLIDKTRQSLADARKPLLVPLVLQKQYEKIKLDALTRDIAAQQGEVALLQKKLSLQTQQAREYLQAKKGFDLISPEIVSLPVGNVLSGQLPATVAPIKLQDRKRLAEAAGYYLDAEGRLRAEVNKTDYELIAAKHERAVAYAEANAMQWETLISSGVNQLADYGTTGIKPEQVVSLLNALSLLWIGSGVNK
jgi:hypothetical protein